MKIKEDICVPTLKKYPDLVTHISEKRIKEVPFKKFSQQTRLDLYKIYTQSIGPKDVLELANLKRTFLGKSFSEKVITKINSEFKRVQKDEVEEFVNDILDESKNPFEPSNLPF